MDAGRLKHRVSFQRQSKAPDGMGGYRETWEDYFPTRAEVKPISSMERVLQDRTTMVWTDKVTIRFREGIRPSDRIKFKSRIFKIESIINLKEENRWLEFLCSEVS